MFFIFSLSLLLSFAHAGTHSQFHVESYAQERSLNQSGFDTENQIFEGYLLTDYSWTATFANFYAELKPQLRAVQSPGVGANGLLDPKATDASFSKRWLNTRRLLGRRSDEEAWVDFDRLSLNYKILDGELSVGRKPVSLGVLRLFPIWNKLTLPLIFRPGPEWIDNPDGAKLTLPFGDFNARLLALRAGGGDQDAIYLGEFRYSLGQSEAQLLLGQWFAQTTAGLTFATDLWGATFRLEGINFSQGAGNQNLSQWGAGVERAFGSGSVFVFEYFQQSICQNLDSGYGITPPTRFQVLNGCRYVFPFLTYQVNSDWRVGGGPMMNVDDQSLVAIADVNYSYSDNLIFELKAKEAMGRRASEFGTGRFTLPAFGLAAGAQSTVYLSLNYTTDL